MTRVFLFIFVFLAMLVTAAENFSSWQKQMPITFSGYTPPGNETLTNFPALIILSNTSAGAGFNYNDFLSPSYGDLRFTASDKTTPLNFEVEKWDVSGNSYVWVQVPALTGTNTQICAFWRKGEVSAPPCTTNGDVWESGFRGTWHMAEEEAGTGSGSVYRDSTAYTNHAADYVSAAGKDGKVNGGQAFDGVDDYIAPGKLINSVSNNYTISFWVSPTTTHQIDPESSGGTGGTSGQRYALWAEHGGSAKGGTGISVGNNGASVYEHGDAYMPALLVWSGTLSGWTHVTVVYQAKQPRLYINGSHVRTGLTSIRNATFPGTQLGGSVYGYFPGNIDEFRVESVSRSSNWIWACYMNMASNNVFNKYGAPVLGGVPRIVNSNAVVRATYVTLNGTLTSAGQDSNVLASVFWGTTDAGNNMAGWTHANWFPGWSTVGTLTTNVALTGPAGARYFYRFFASNSLGSAWASPAGSFSSLGAPSVNNAGGVTDMGFFSATLHGEVLGGNPMPRVSIYWGTVNQGTNKALWEHEILIDEFSSWAFAATIEGLTPDITHFYICYASNSYGEAWSPMATAFTPGLGKVHYVDKANPFPGSPYLTWANAATNIQDAIDVAVSGELVLVTNGVYDTGTRVAGAMNNRVAITNAIIVMAASTNPADTIIAGAPDPGTGGIGAGAIRGVFVGVGAQLIGFTVSNSCTIAGQYGGGVYAAANSIVRNCVITTNQAVYGGGIYVDAGVVSDCEITANIASGGGGVYGNANSIIRNCNIYSNQGIAGANNYGGGVSGGAYYNCRIISNGRVGGWTVGGIEGGAGGYGGSYYNCHIISNIGNYAAGLRSPTIVQDCEIRGNSGNNGGGGFGDGSIYTRCRISENTASQGAGGVCGEYSLNPPTTLLVNCLIFSNSVGSGGGACMHVAAVNCTIYGNTGGHGGGFATWNGNYGTSYVTNCIVISNGVMNFGIGTYYVGYTCTTTNTGTFPGAVNIITNNPMFVDPTTNDFRIVRTSPCFNTGINQEWMVNSIDLDGNPRICNFNVDMGAYEYSRPQGTIFTILGTPAP